MSRPIKIASLLCLLFLVELAPVRQCYAQTADPPKPPVYVGSFDIDVVPAKNDRNVAGGRNPSADQRGEKKEETAAQHARRLVDLLSNDLLEALWKAGYSAQRLGPNQGRPSGGVQIRGVFAEVDSENHWRRAVIRSGSDSGKLEVLVSVANLARPEQALYEIARLPGNENKPGAVITLSPYAPLTKFETDKDPEENQFKRIASRVVADLTALLNTNPAALTQ
jgi:hypothetical protein